MKFLFEMMLKRLKIERTHAVSIQRDIKVPMPDGAHLLTDVYMGDPTGKAPVVLIRSPYGKSPMFAAMGAYPLAARGFNVVMQCCRGTWGSTGTFDPHHDEQRDGLATIEWIKQQSWYDGAIATYGMSYLGYTQWAIAASAGPEVQAMAMQVTLSNFSHMTYAGDSMMLENAFSWTHMMTGMKNGGMFFARYVLSMVLGREMLNDKHWKVLPLADMDVKNAGERVKFWQDWIQHDSSKDPWWAPMSHRESINKINRPITMVAGWYDIFLPWQLKDFTALRDAGCETRLTIGPWSHSDQELAREGVHDALDWFAKHLLGKPLQHRPKAVKLFVIGADEWRYFDAWPPRESTEERWYLHPDKKLSTVMPPSSEPDQIRYDPANPTPSIGGPALSSKPCVVDNRALEARNDVLTFTSEPLASAHEFIGPVFADLYVTSTAPSADFFVRLCDVDPHGISRNICDGLQRHSFTNIAEPSHVRIELWPTAYRLPKGHRLRVQVSNGAFPRWTRNLGTNDKLGKGVQMRAATQSIYHAPSAASSIVVCISNDSSRS